MRTQEVSTQTKWGIDPMHSQIGFKVKHLMFTNIRGVFKKYRGSITTHGDDFIGASIELTINPASISTNDEKRDAHLQSADFFDVANFDEITFRGNSMVKQRKDGMFTLIGGLTMKGITKAIELSIEFGGIAKDIWGNEKAVFRLSGTINRKDWGLSWNAALETGGVLVGEDVTLDIEVQLGRLE